MSRPIYKTVLHPGITNVAGRPLSAGLDAHGQPCVWFVHGDGTAVVQTVGTGWDVPHAGRFLGTWTLPADGLVFHSFVTQETAS